MKCANKKISQTILALFLFTCSPAMAMDQNFAPFDFKTHVEDVVNNFIIESWQPGGNSDARYPDAALRVIVENSGNIRMLPWPTLQECVRRLNGAIQASPWHAMYKQDLAGYLETIRQSAWRDAIDRFHLFQVQRVANFHLAVEGFDKEFALSFWHLIHDAKVASLEEKPAAMQKIVDRLREFQPRFLFSQPDYLIYTQELITEAQLPEAFENALMDIFVESYFAPIPQIKLDNLAQALH